MEDELACSLMTPLLCDPTECMRDRRKEKRERKRERERERDGTYIYNK